MSARKSGLVERGAPPDDMNEVLMILVVTDNDAVRQQLEYGLPLDLQVTCAREARDASAWLREHVPSAVVVDLQTGSAGGYALAHDMRAEKRLATVPVVMLLERYQDEWLAREAGADRAFVKPVDAAEILAAVTELVSGSPAS